jgi:hypothetical protein
MSALPVKVDLGGRALLALHCHLNLRAIGSNRLGDDMLQQIACGGAVSV